MAAAPKEPVPLSGVAKWTVMATIVLGCFVYSLNGRGTVLQENLITQEFALDRYSAQWITGPSGVVGLTAFFASIYLVQAFGARRIFIIGVVCLCVGCLIVALARTAWQDFLGALVRNASSLYMIPGLVIFQRQAPRRRLLSYCVILTLVYAGQVLVEPIGAIIAFHPSWRALFVFMALCGLWFILCGIFFFTDDRPEHPPEQPFDYLGMILFACGLALIFFLLYRGNYLGWGVSTAIQAATIGLLVIAALFVWRQLVAPAPFLPVGAFGYRTVTLTMIVSGFWCASLYGVAIHLPNFLLLIGFQHWKTGWVMVPMGLILTLSMFVGSFVTRRWWYVWQLRFGLAGMTAVGYFMAKVDIYTIWQWVVGMTSMWSFFAGACLGPIAQLTFEGQRPEAAGATSAMKFFVRALAGTLGILGASVFLERSAANGLEYVRSSVVRGQGPVLVDEPEIRDHMARQGSAPESAVVQTEAVLGYWVNLHAQVIGYRTVLRFCAYLTAVGLLITCFIGHRKEFSVFDADL
jgi:MFS family permease